LLRLIANIDTGILELEVKKRDYILKKIEFGLIYFLYSVIISPIYMFEVLRKRCNCCELLSTMYFVNKNKVCILSRMKTGEEVVFSTDCKEWKS
jgi:hypothetical protein